MPVLLSGILGGGIGGDIAGASTTVSLTVRVVDQSKPIAGAEVTVKKSGESSALTGTTSPQGEWTVAVPVVAPLPNIPIHVPVHLPQIPPIKVTVQAPDRVSRAGIIPWNELQPQDRGQTSRTLRLEVQLPQVKPFAALVQDETGAPFDFPTAPFLMELSKPINPKRTWLSLTQSLSLYYGRKVGPGSYQFDLAPSGDGFLAHRGKFYQGIKVSNDGTTQSWIVERRTTSQTLQLRYRDGSPVIHESLVVRQLTVDGPSGPALPVELSSGEIFHSDEKGNIHLDPIPSGTYRVAPLNRFNNRHSARFATESDRPGAEAAGTTFTVLAGKSTEPMVLTYAQGLTLLGQVTDRATSEPIHQAKVVISGMSPPFTTETFTSSNGYYRMDNLPVQFGQAEFRVRVIARGYHHAILEPWYGNQGNPVPIPPGAEEVQEDISLRKLVTVSGRVVDRSTSQPAIAARIELLETQADPVITGPEGTFQLTVAPDSAIRIMASLERRGRTISDLIQVGETPVTGVQLVLDGELGLGGVVVNENGEPISGAFVDLRAERTGSADAFGRTQQLDWKPPSLMTADDGRFFASNLPPGSLILRVRAKNFADSEELSLSPSPVLTFGKSATSVTVTLQRGGSLGGVVLDQAGKPVPSAYIQGFPPESRSGFGRSTDGDGRFLFPDFRLGKAMVLVYHGAQSEWFYDLEVGREDHKLKLGTGDAQGLRSPFSRSRTGTSIPVIVRVVDWKTDKPVPKFQADGLGVLQVKIREEEPGTFELIGTQPGFMYGFRVEADGYAPYSTRNLFVEPGEAQVERTVRMGPGGSITGKVVTEDKLPLAGVLITQSMAQVYGQTNRSRSTQGQTVKTNDEGVFILEGLGSGSHGIRFEPPAQSGAVVMTRSVQVVSNDLTDMGLIVMGSGGGIEGRLVRMPGSVPIPNAMITHNQSNANNGVRTDQDGRFAFRKLLPGTYRIQSTEYGANLVVGVENLETKVVTLEAGTGRLIGKVTSNGSPMAASITARKIGYGQSLSRYGTARSDGNFTLENLVPGRWEVILTDGADGSRTMSKFVTMPEDGSAVEEQFAFPAASLAITVLSSTGEPAGAGVYVRCRAETPGSTLLAPARNGATQADSRVVFENLRPGKYSIVAESGPQLRGEATGVEVRESTDPTETRISLTGTGDRGSVASIALSMADGKPVPTAWLNLYRPNGTIQEHRGIRNEYGVLMAENIPPGQYVAQVSALGYSVDEQGIEVKSGETLRLESVLYPSGALRWALKDTNGKSATGIACKLRPLDPESIEEPRSGETNDDGVFVVRGLYPGAYLATATLAPASSSQPNREVTATVQIYAANVTDAVAVVPAP